MTARALPHRSVVPVVGLAAALTLSACLGAPPPAPAPAPAPSPPPSGGGGGSSAPPSPAACQGASEGETSIVTVEASPTGPEITSTPVDSQAEADAVVAEAAADGDLIAAEFDQPRFADNHAPSMDTHRSQQWALNNVNFEDAWASANNGGTGQVVAVIDTGVSANHPDLSGQVLPGQFFLHSDNGSHPFFGPGGTTDTNGHGTHVAGIIGAIANNSTGVTGAAPAVDILPVQVLCGDDGSGFSSDVAAGIIWAADHGAHVINLSLGGGFSNVEQEAVQYATEMKGVVVVASAGNTALKGNAPSFPGAFPEVIAVAALLNNNTRANYSTTGPYVDIAAPGGATGGNPSTGILSTWNNGGYATIAGTSMASPHVAAAAALVRAAHGFTTHADVCNQLIRSADNLGNPNEYGHGRVDPLEGVGPVIVGGPSCT